MLLWIILTILTSAAAVLASIPFLRRFEEGQAEGTNRLNIFKDQLHEVDKELADGHISKDEAGLARTEIERRMLAAADAPNPKTGGLGADRRQFAVVAVAGIVVLGSVTLYAANGRPDLAAAKPAQNTLTASLKRLHSAADRSEGDTQAQKIAAMVKRLEDRLKNKPRDADGWRVLGWSYYNTQRFKKAATAYGRAGALRTENAVLKSLQGEALVKAAGGRVAADAEALFKRALAIDPKDVRARYFAGVAKQQSGDTKAALQAWKAMLESAPANAKWAGELRKRVIALARQTGVDPGRLPSPPDATGQVEKRRAPERVAQAPRGPSAEDIKNAKKLTPEDRQSMIRAMVDGLAQRLEKSPNDPDGWIRLIRSRVVLREPDKAKATLARALKEFAGAPAVRAKVENAARAMGVTAQ